MSNERSCQCGQSATHGACTTEFQYAVKLLCGEVVPPQEGATTPVAPGRYYTNANIHNPDKCRDAHFRWKVAVANPDKPGPVSAYQELEVLHPDEALEIDCPQVARVMQTLPPPPPRFVKGYVVIESDIELDVVAVYSGTPGACGSNSFQTERVPARCVPVCEDLVLPLHTGVARWQTIAPAPAGPVVTLTGVLHPMWGVPPFGSSWVSQAAADKTNASPGVRSYQLCFDLCSGFTPPTPFQIQVLADYSAQVYLNGNLVGSVSGPAGITTPQPLTVNPNFLHAGNNCVQVDVTNDPQKAPNPTGFALAGLLRVIRGKCPCSPLPILAPSPRDPFPEPQSVEPSQNQRKRVTRTRKSKGKTGR